MKIKYIISISIVLFLCVSAASGMHYIAKANHREALPVLGSIQPFSLIDTKGRDFNEKELNNKIWVADFIFTTCAGVCPIMTKNMSSIYRSYFLEDDVRFVSISVNPEYDSPQIMNQYASRYNANTSKWHFLTGKREDIKNLAVNSFKIGSAEEPVFHSSNLVLIDKNFQIRGYYEGTKDRDVRSLFMDLAKLMKEK